MGLQYYIDSQSQIRVLGEAVPQWLVDIAKDIVLTEVDTSMTAKKPNFELAFRTVGHGMPLDFVLNACGRVVWGVKHTTQINADFTN